MDISSLLNSTNQGLMIVVSLQDLQDYSNTLINKTVVRLMNELRMETYSASEVCQLLHISRSTLSIWQRDGKVKVVGRAGNKNEYSKTEIDKLVEKNKFESSEDAFVLKLRAERRKMLSE